MWYSSLKIFSFEYFKCATMWKPYLTVVLDRLVLSPSHLSVFTKDPPSAPHRSLTHKVHISVLCYQVPLLTCGAILKSNLVWEELGASPRQGRWRLNVQTAGRVKIGHLDPHLELANRDAAATLAKCIPQGPGLNPCLTLTDKLYYG